MRAFRPDRHDALALLAGLCWGLSHPDVGGVIAVVLGAMCHARSLVGRPGADALRGLTTGIVWQGVALHWVRGSLADFGVGGSSAVFAGLIVLQALPTALAGGVYGWAQRWQPSTQADAARLYLAWMCTAAVAPWIQPIPLSLLLGLTGTPWFVAGAFGPPMIPLVTAAVVASCGRGVVRWVFLGWWLVGAAIAMEPFTSDDTVRVGIVQPDLGAFEGRRSSADDDRVATFVRLAHEVADADLVVGPEDGWPYDLGRADRAAEAAALFADLPPTIVGATVRDGDATYNRLTAFDDGEIVGTFDKVHLVPLTEKKVLGLGRDLYAPGTTPRSIVVDGLELLPVICFEDLFPSVRTEHPLGAPHLVVAASNDAFLGDGWGPGWHLAAARLLAISSRTPVVRPTTSGISAVIDPRGRLLWHTDWVDGDDPANTGTAAIVEVPLPWSWRRR